VFNLAIPQSLEGIPAEILDPAKAWKNLDAFHKQRKMLGGMFVEAFKKYASDCSPEVCSAGPNLA